MTSPVPVEAGRDLLLTRRTFDRCFFLRPHPVINQIIRYCLAYYAGKYGIRLYAYVALSNHHHIACHDTYGVYPEFCRDFHSIVARAVNCLLGRREALWSPDRQNAVILFDDESRFDEITYTISNSAISHLVDRVEDWPGVLSLVSDLASAPREVKRPDVFFSPDSYPEFATLHFVKPDSFSNWTTDQYRAEVSRRVEEKCQEARNERRQKGISVVGRLKILEQDPYDRPKTPGASRTNKLLFACRDIAIRRELLEWLQRFRALHREARLSFEAGNREAKFPHGTYLHRRRYGVDCSALGPPPSTA